MGPEPTGGERDDADAAEPQFTAVKTPKPAVGPPPRKAEARLAKPASSLLVAFGVAMSMGLAWGNYHYMFMGFALLALVAVGWQLKPAEVVVERGLSQAKARIGDTVTVVWRVRTRKTPGLLNAVPVVLRDEVPEMFSLIEGTNVHLYWPEQGEMRYAYKMRCTRRGEFDLQPTWGSFVHPLRFRPPEVKAVGEVTRLLVEPRLKPVKRMLGVRHHASLPMPDEDRAFHGLESNQFREVREYTMGDPLKRVNWKASARHSTAGNLELMVNEYEREGKKSIWFFLDAAYYMETGTTETTSLDQSITALLEMLSFFAERGYRIGGAVFNAHEDRVFHPEVGRRPYYLVAKFLMGVGPGKPKPGETHGLAAAVERSKRFLLSERPLVLAFTRPEADIENTQEAVRLLRRYTMPARTPGNRPAGRTPLWFVVPRISGAASRAGLTMERERLQKLGAAVAGSVAMPGPSRERILPVSARLAEASAAAQRATIRQLGVVLLEWEPDREPIHGLLVRGTRMLAAQGVRT